MALLALAAWGALGMTVPLSGMVEDAAGRPVAGATVWLGDTVATRQGPEVLATAETDDRGHFRLERADDLAGRGGIWSPTLWAFKPGSRIAFIEFKRNVPGADEPVRLVLGPPASASVRVVRPDGKPAAGARVRVAQLDFSNFKAPRPPDEMLDRLAATTDTDGRATLDGLAAPDIGALDVTAPGQLVQCLQVDPETGSVSLRPLGRLKVRVVADDPKAARGWEIKAWSRPNEPNYRGPSVQWVSETTGIDGRAEFPSVAAGGILWDIKPPEGSAYLMISPRGATVRAGQTEEVEIKVLRGVRVEGVVAEEPGGAPIPGVKVDVSSLKHFSGRSHPVATDARGRFSTLVVPGTARFSFYFDVPKEYFLPPGVQHWVDFEVKEGLDRQTITPPRLRSGVLIRGKVLDEAGKPTAGVRVVGHWTSPEYGRNPNSVRAETDARGEFVLGNIAPKSEVRLSAMSDAVAESESVTVPDPGAGEPITLRLVNRATLALSGRVLGPDGRPLAGASIRVKIRAPDQGGSSGGDFTFEGSEGMRTEPDGRYRTPPRLPVGNHYQVEAQAPGYDPARSRWVVPPAVEVPDLTLRRSVGSREVAGRVVDSAGRPVEGAEVFQSGDGPRRTRGITDGEGRFRVPGVPDAPAFLFASRAGYHFLGRRIDANDRAIEFTLRRLDEPPGARLRPAAPALSRDEERAIARVLIDEARRAPGGVHEVWERREIPEIIALVDPDRTVAMIENQVVTAEPALLAALAVGRFEGDRRKALELLDAIGEPGAASLTALNLFDRLGTTARPEFRRELLERAGGRSREIEDAGPSASQLARVADRWLDLGDLDRGTKLAREAQALAEKPRRSPFPDPHDDLALALARVELPAALKLMEGRGEAQQHASLRLLAGIAERVAPTDPAAARRVVGMIQDQWQRQSARRDACLRMAAKDLPAARALLAEDRDPMVEAILPAVAARARAESDPDGARALLRESVDRLAKLGEEPAAGPSPAVALARLLPLATRIDPDRAPDALWRSLSLRPPLSALPEPMPVLPDVRRHYLDLAELAVLVARYDRASAEVVFAPVAARLVGLDDEHWGLGPEGPALFRAAGAFDGRVAEALLDALPEDPPTPTGPTIRASDPRHHSKAQARIALARALGLPPGLRLRGPFIPSAGDDWLEGLDD